MNECLKVMSRESYKHLKSIPDDEYEERTVTLEIVEQGKYRKLIGNEAEYFDIDKKKSRYLKGLIPLRYQVIFYT